ncbi:hypothetical protein ARMSODRAFT_951125 [Armillaria solidipes]|uniref:Uncharacterized protein n=1 Tax=Armillaria solidipes TaxID=1076256 RepID=A0A2H3C9R0_9AGAR|nr:hypothetical protein ARMSODRAFT_951125 [Armillaria solidipes]
MTKSLLMLLQESVLCSRKHQIEHEDDAAWIICLGVLCVVEQVLRALDSTLLVERRTPSRDFRSFGYVDFITSDNERQDIKAVSVQASTISLRQRASTPACVRT